MKQLDNRNETARKKELAREDPQPYGQLFVDSRLACPHCNAQLRHIQHPTGRPLPRHDNECDCSWWDYDWMPQKWDKWKRTPKNVDIQPATEYNAVTN